MLMLTFVACLDQDLFKLFYLNLLLVKLLLKLKIKCWQ